MDKLLLYRYTGKMHNAETHSLRCTLPALGISLKNSIKLVPRESVDSMYAAC